MKIENKRVVVTGAASGIGKALCEEFYAAKAKSIVCVDMNLEGATDTANSVNGLAVSADVSKEQDIINVIEKADEYSGGIDIFCSNAGIGGKPGFFEADPSDWELIWGVNVQSHIHAAKHVLPQMIERGEGYLMNTSSAAGLLTQLGAAGYAVTKAAAVSFAEWIAMTANGPGVAGVDGMMEADVVAKDVLNAIEEERFLVTPHQEVLEYVQRKGNDRDRWISGMQRLQKQYEDFLTPMEED